MSAHRARCFTKSILGKFGYVGRKLHLMVMPGEYIFPENVYFLYYPNAEESQEWLNTKVYHHKSKNSLIGMEIPEVNGGYDYPLPFKSEQQRCNDYFEAMPKGVFL